MTLAAVVEVTPSLKQAQSVPGLVRATIKQLCQQYPSGNEALLTDQLYAMAMEDPGLFKSCCRFCVTATLLNQARVGHLQQSRTPQARRSRQAKARATAKIVVAKLLDMVMPNKKALRFCLGREVATFGAGFTRIAETVPADQMVGCVLVESEVRALLKVT
jgi:hypothetical protein